MKCCWLGLSCLLLLGCNAIVDADADRLGEANGECPGGCDDGISCTRDSCDNGECVHTPDDTLCDPGQTCVAAAGGSGCVADCPLDCSTPPGCPGDSCYDCSKQGFCNDDQTECIYSLRDADGDGHVPTTVGSADCRSLGSIADDCNDNPDFNGALMFPGNEEICNGLDSDCDGSIDESDGIRCPGRDCSNPFAIEFTNGRFEHEAVLANFVDNYGQLQNLMGDGCTSDGQGPDVLYQMTLTETRDVVLVASGQSEDLDVALSVSDGGCSTGAFQDWCHGNIADPEGYRWSKIYLSSVGPGTFYVMIKGVDSGEVGPFRLTATSSAPASLMCGAQDQIDITGGGLLVAPVSLGGITDAATFTVSASVACGAANEPCGEVQTASAAFTPAICVYDACASGTANCDSDGPVTDRDIAVNTTTDPGSYYVKIYGGNQNDRFILRYTPPFSELPSPPWQ